jgi:antitoxin (DNA-binding transcriptional repressor) of toxin-antitoxin stability system
MMNTMTATEFKAKCLEIFDQLKAGEIEKLTITKRGEPVAVLRGPESEADLLRNLYGSMRGSVIIPEGFDLTAPVLDEALDAENGILHR